MRSGRSAYLTVGGYGKRRSLELDITVSAEELSRILERICDGSLYAYGESIIKGYVALDGGVRVGVCGRAAVEGGRILGVYDVSALNLRLPCRCVSIDRGISELIRREAERGGGTLIYSPPGGGKTTFLRSLLPYLVQREDPMRVAVVDTGDELMGARELEGLPMDVLSGYPKAEGIRIATAYMNPQVIVCDEISNEEAVAVAEAQNSGVALIASTHGSDASALLSRSGMRKLFSVGAFAFYVGIGISRGGFDCRVQRREEMTLACSGDDSGLC